MVATLMLSAPLSIKLDDDDTERVCRSIRNAVVELQKLPAVSLTVIAGVQLTNAITTPVKHGLGRAPLFVGFSAVRNPTTVGTITAGVIVEMDSPDRASYINLQASGYTVTPIVVDVLVL